MFLENNLYYFRPLKQAKWTKLVKAKRDSCHFLLLLSSFVYLNSHSLTLFIHFIIFFFSATYFELQALYEFCSINKVFFIIIIIVCKIIFRCCYQYKTNWGVQGRPTISLFFDLEGHWLPSHLQEMDGLAQRLSFQTDPIDGQNSVPDVDGPGPAGLEEERRQRYQRIPDSTDGQAGESWAAARALTETETKRLLVTAKKRRDNYCWLSFFVCLIIIISEVSRKRLLQISLASV